jgi:nicotinamidase-related amidase
MRLRREDALLVVIDIQTKLHVHMQDREAFTGAAARAIRGCRALGVPVLVTEQYPEGVGRTIDEIRVEIEGYAPILKTSFSCCGENAFVGAIEKSGRRQIVLCGIESHVCVYQTARDLLEKGYEVYLLADAVSSRHEKDREFALRALERMGVRLVTTEMALFDLLHVAGTDDFRKILKIVK